MRNKNFIESHNRIKTGWNRLSVFAKIVDPAQQLRLAITQNFRASVTVDQVSPDETMLVIHSFTTIRQDPSGLTYSTLEISLQNAQRVLDQYRFAPHIQPDFSPDITWVTFPDDYPENYYNQIAIPVIRHTQTS
jgi:hypothetical protein